MNTPSTILAASAVLAITTLPAFATVAKTWVSSTGTDSGSCQLVAPCKTFQFAHDQTTPGGEIDVKDTGSYGQLTITKAISIVSGDGALAAVGVPASTDGITITAGSSDKVVLQGLVIDGHGAGRAGVQFNQGLSLTVRNCTFRNLYIGIHFSPAQGPTSYEFVDTEIAGASAYGLVINTPAQTHGTISHVNVHHNSYGADIEGSLVEVTNDIFSLNDIGINAGFNSEVLLANSVVSGNGTAGIQLGSGTVSSYGDNYISRNGTDVSGGSLGTVAKR